MFQELSFLDRFDAAADAGFDAVECQFPYAWPANAIATRLARTGLALAMFNMPAGDFAAGECGFAAVPGKRDELRRSVRMGIEYAVATGVRKLHMLAGCADAADANAMSAYLWSLHLALEQLAPHGIELLIEPLNGHDMPAYFLDSFALAEKILAEVRLPSLKLQFDIYHRQILHGDVTMALRRLLPVIGHVQVASVPGRHEPGSGELDDFRLFEELDALSYAGFVGCEYLPASGTREGLSWFARAIGRAPSS